MPPLVKKSLYPGTKKDRDRCGQDGKTLIQWIQSIPTASGVVHRREKFRKTKNTPASDVHQENAPRMMGIRNR